MYQRSTIDYRLHNMEEAIDYLYSLLDSQTDRILRNEISNHALAIKTGIQVINDYYTEIQQLKNQIRNQKREIEDLKSGEFKTELNKIINQYEHCLINRINELGEDFRG